MRNSARQTADRDIPRHVRWEVGLFLSISLLAGGTLHAAEPGNRSSRDLHKQGQYAAAATLGLTELLRAPWDHELRFVVADSLQRSGRLDEAVIQFEALEGTAYAESATLRLNAIRQPVARQPSNIEAARRPNASPAPSVVVAPVSPRLQPPATRQVSVTANPSPPTTPPARTPAQQHIYDLYAAEDYATAATLGLALFAQERPEDQLRLIVSNSLAWTGHLREASQQYKLLTNSSLSQEATVGLANVYRWRGHDDQALPLYRAVLAADPANPGAKEGLSLALRETQPRTLVTMGGTQDSFDVERRAVTINHRWHEESTGNVVEVEIGGVNDRLPGTEANQGDLTLRYQAMNLPLQPRFELSAQATPERTAFGSVRAKLGDEDVYLEAGRVNWGRMASNSRAVLSNLTATHLGLDASRGLSIGKFSARADYFDISDGNTILTSNLSFVPAWRPLGSHLKPFLGIEARDASAQSANYWSPEKGYGTAYVGLLGEWGNANGEFFASGQTGVRLLGEAGSNWSLSAGGRRWITQDIALGLNFWSLSSWRDNLTYRATSLNLTVVKVWN